MNLFRGFNIFTRRSRVKAREELVADGQAMGDYDAPPQKPDTVELKVGDNCFERSRKLLKLSGVCGAGPLVGYIAEGINGYMMLDKQHEKFIEWIPISEFDHRMFSIMTNGTPDCTAVVKYKGEVPEWATHWKPLDDMPK